MHFGNYAKTMYADKYLGQIKDKYLYLTGQKNYSPTTIEPKPTDTSSIDSLIDLDSKALLDRVINTACSIVYRLKIYKDITSQLDYSSLKAKNELLDLESSFYRGRNMNIERRKSMIFKELMQLNKQRSDQKVETWKDLSQPVSYFVNLFHENKEIQQDQKMLKE